MFTYLGLSMKTSIFKCQVLGVDDPCDKGEREDCCNGCVLNFSEYINQSSSCVDSLEEEDYIEKNRL